MFKYLLATAALAVAGTPAALGLAGNASFTRDVPVRVPAQVQTVTPTSAATTDDDGTADRGHGGVEPGDDRGGDVPRAQRTEAGDDHGRTTRHHAEPGDDHGGTTRHHAEPGDDHGGTSGRGSDDGSGHDSGDDHGGRTSGSSGSGSSGSDDGHHGGDDSSGSGSSGGGSDDGSGHD